MVGVIDPGFPSEEEHAAAMATAEAKHRAVHTYGVDTDTGTHTHAASATVGNSHPASSGSGAEGAAGSRRASTDSKPGTTSSAGGTPLLRMAMAPPDRSEIVALGTPVAGNGSI